jgi:hypothetical protein
MAARSLEGMFANIDVDHPGSPPHSPPRSVSTLSDGGDTVISVHSTDSEGTVDTVPYDDSSIIQDSHEIVSSQDIANTIKDLLESDENDDQIVKYIRQQMIYYIAYNPNLRARFPYYSYPRPTPDSDIQIRAVLTNPRFKELFSQDEYASLKEKLGMENVGGGRRRHKSAKKHHKRRYNKKTHNKKHKKSSKKTRGRKHKKSMRKHKKVVRKTSKKTHRRRR